MSRGRYSLYIVQLAAILAFSLLALAEPSPNHEKDITEGRQWGETVEKMALSIATEKQKYAPGEQIVLNVLLKNVGNKEVFLWEEAPLAGYRPTVLLPDGKKTPLTFNGKIVSDSDLVVGISSSGTKLKLGEMGCVEFVMNKLYDFSQSGKYVVSVRRIRIIAINGVELRKPISIPSNSLEITVDSSLHSPKVPLDEPNKPEQEHIWLNMPEDQKIEDFRFGTLQDRLNAARWLGDKRRFKAVRVLARRIETILASQEESSSAKLELATICFALGQIGNPKGFPAVKKACERLSDLCPRSLGSGAFDDLFNAYHGMALLGHKAEALIELNRIYKNLPTTSHAEMDAHKKKEYEALLEKAEKW